jgi:hypothetical protein
MNKELITLLEHQRTLYRQLRLLAERQKSLVVQENVQPLLTLLQDRQKLVDGLTGLNARLAPYREGWTQTFSTLDESTRKHVMEMLEEANSTLGAILQSDTRDSATLTARRDQTSDRMAALDSGARAGAAYGAAHRMMQNIHTDARV